MNYALLKSWVVERVEDLVQFGVPRPEAERMMMVLEHDAVCEEAKSRNDAQFLLDFRRVGVTVLAERHGVTPQAIRKRRSRLLQNNVRPCYATAE